MLSSGRSFDTMNGMVIRVVMLNCSRLCDLNWYVFKASASRPQHDHKLERVTSTE
jgi:hypothetical protein